MSEPFIGEIKIVGFNFAPRGWTQCDGQLLPISQNSALFSLLGTTYGGDGETTFGLPDLRGRGPIHKGTGPGLTPRILGARGGQESVNLTLNQIPSHNHPGVQAVDEDANSDQTGNALANTAEDIYNSASPTGTTGNAGGSQSHENMPPYLVVNYVIALTGIFPSRS